MNKSSITNTLQPTISYWTNNYHGLEAITVPFNMLMGIVVYFAARTLGLLYIIMQIDFEPLAKKAKNQIKITGPAFVLAFVALLFSLFTMTGYHANPENGFISAVRYKYFFNMTELIWPFIMLFTGVILVIGGLANTLFGKGKGSFYITGAGVVLAVWSLLICAAFNNTAFFVSTVDIQNSLTLQNSSSSEFTLKVMAYASLMVPFVFAYIVYVWRAMTKVKMSNEDLLKPDTHKY